MPELVRFVVGRLRHFVANRRSARRTAIRLRCTVGLATGRLGAGRVHRDTSLEGQTCDISVTGLGLLMPAIHIEGRYLSGADKTLLILLELPDTPILLKGVAVRYERLEQDDSEMRYLLGVRITEMSDTDRTLLLTLFN